MGALNKAMIIGNLGQDPELRYTGSGTAVCNMRVATNDSWTNPEGEREERTEWHTVVAWGKLGEICNEHLRKGSQAYFEGPLQTRQWEDKEGNTRYSTEIKAKEVQFLSGSFTKETLKPATNGQKKAPVAANADTGFTPNDELPF